MELEELRRFQKRSLDTDKRLLQYLTELSRNIEERGREITAKIDNFDRNVGKLEIDLANLSTNLNLLADFKFAEKRVDDNAEQKGESIEDEKEESVNDYEQSVKNALLNCTQYISNSANNENREDGSSTSAFGEGSNKYLQRQLPHLFGTEAFMNDNYVGLKRDEEPIQPGPTNNFKVYSDQNMNKNSIMENEEKLPENIDTKREKQLEALAVTNPIYRNENGRENYNEAIVSTKQIGAHPTYDLFQGSTPSTKGANQLNEYNKSIEQNDKNEEEKTQSDKISSKEEKGSERLIDNNDSFEDDFLAQLNANLNLSEDRSEKGVKKDYLGQQGRFQDKREREGVTVKKEKENKGEDNNTKLVEERDQINLKEEYVKERNSTGKSNKNYSIAQLADKMRTNKNDSVQSNNNTKEELRKVSIDNETINKKESKMEARNNLTRPSYDLFTSDSKNSANNEESSTKKAPKMRAREERSDNYFQKDEKKKTSNTSSTYNENVDSDDEFLSKLAAKMDKKSEANESKSKSSEVKNSKKSENNNENNNFAINETEASEANIKAFKNAENLGVIEDKIEEMKTKDKVDNMEEANLEKVVKSEEKMPKLSFKRPKRPGSLPRSNNNNKETSMKTTATKNITAARSPSKKSLFDFSSDEELETNIESSAKNTNKSNNKFAKTLFAENFANNQSKNRAQSSDVIASSRGVEALLRAKEEEKETDINTIVTTKNAIVMTISNREQKVAVKSNEVSNDNAPLVSAASINYSESASLEQTLIEPNRNSKISKNENISVNDKNSKMNNNNKPILSKAFAQDLAKALQQRSLSTKEQDEADDSTSENEEYQSKNELKRGENTKKDLNDENKSHGIDDNANKEEEEERGSDNPDGIRSVAKRLKAKLRHGKEKSIKKRSIDKTKMTTSSEDNGSSVNASQSDLKPIQHLSSIERSVAEMRSSSVPHENKDVRNEDLALPTLRSGSLLSSLTKKRVRGSGRPPSTIGRRALATANKNNGDNEVKSYNDENLEEKKNREGVRIIDDWSSDED